MAAWLLEDDDEARADRILDQLAEEEALVPHLWHLETSNSLLTAERSGRLSPDEVEERLDALKGLPIATEENPDSQSALNLAGNTGSPCMTRST